MGSELLKHFQIRASVQCNLTVFAVWRVEQLEQRRHQHVVLFKVVLSIDATSNENKMLNFVFTKNILQIVSSNKRTETKTSLYDKNN